MKKILILISLLVTTLNFSLAETAKPKEEFIKLKVVKTDSSKIEAKIVNLTPKAKELGLDKIKIMGKKSSIVNSKGKAVTEIVWNGADVNQKSITLNPTFVSKIVVSGSLGVGDQFKAKGDVEGLLSLLKNVDSPSKDKDKNNQTAISRNSSGLAGSTTPNANNSKLSALSTEDSLSSDISSSETKITTTTSNGCSLRVDYELNRVYVQERVIDENNKEVQGCVDSASYYLLNKDYENCPKITNTNSKKIIPYFQNYYIDSAEVQNLVGSCQPDENRATNLEIIKYACDDQINLTSNIVYAKYKQYYKDSDGEEVLLSDCTIDPTESWTITQDINSCGLSHKYDVGYSITRIRKYYQRDGIEIEVASCQDGTQKYAHLTTSDGCNNVINDNQITIFSRKYIIVDGITTYISECEPLNSNIEEENCNTTPFTHDFNSGQSYRNKNYFYYDQNGIKKIVSNCIKSDETYQQQTDTSVCLATKDDVNLQTMLSGKIYITVDNQRQYISSCESISPTIPYQLIGYQWTKEYDLNSASLSWTGGNNNTYIGSLQGRTINTGVSGLGKNQETSILIDQYDISNYSTNNKCSTPSQLYYSGNQVDINYSDIATIKFDNYIRTSSSSSLCYKECQDIILNNVCSKKATAVNSYVTTELVTVCMPTTNSLYYQMCDNYNCPINKHNKKPIYRRYDGTEYINNSETLESKYTCGGSSLSGTTIYY